MGDGIPLIISVPQSECFVHHIKHEEVKCYAPLEYEICDVTKKFTLKIKIKNFK